MSFDELIDSHVSLKQCKRAVEALHTYESKKQAELEETELLTGKEPYIWLNVTVKTVSPTRKFKPSRISVEHPIVDPRTSPVCLITKDPQRQYKDLLESNGVKFVSRVVGVEKLKGKFKAYEARRVLLKEYDLFLADERVVPLLPKLLGTKFFAAKKQPIPVCLTRKGVKGELERAISSTYMNQNQGTCTSVKVARLSHTPAQILDNIKAAIPSIVKHIKGGWENIQSFQLKTSASVSLPVWNCALDDTEEGRWHGVTAGGDEEVSGENGSEDEAAMKVDPSKAGSPKKNKKRASGEEEEEEAEKPRKKAKGSSDATSSSPSTKSKQPTAAAAPVTKESSKSGKGNDVPAKVKKGKLSESVQNGSSTAAVSTTISTSTAETSKSKGKKSKAAVTSVNEKPDEDAAKKTEAAPMSSKDNKKRKQKGDSNDASSVPVAAATALSSKDKTKKEEKNGAKSVDAGKIAAEAVAAVSVSKDELKQKRNAVVGEKKKEKIVKSKGGKSAKHGLLGKKVAQA